jgi:hypothetical protein
VAMRKEINEIAKKIANERDISLSEARRLLDHNPMSEPQFARAVALETVRSFSRERAKRWWEESAQMGETAKQLQTIPDRAVDKVIRYGNAIERHMSRAYARLERLQARRKGEPVPPVVDVRLTR